MTSWGLRSIEVAPASISQKILSKGSMQSPVVPGRPRVEGKEAMMDQTDLKPKFDCEDCQTTHWRDTCGSRASRTEAKGAKQPPLAMRNLQWKQVWPGCQCPRNAMSWATCRGLKRSHARRTSSSGKQGPRHHQRNYLPVNVMVRPPIAVLSPPIQQPEPPGQGRLSERR